MRQFELLRGPSRFLGYLFYVLPDPNQDFSKAKLPPFQRAFDELVAFISLDIEVETVASQKNVGCRECDAFVSIDEPVVHPQGLHQGGSFFLLRIVVASLRSKHGRLYRTCISYTVQPPEQFDQPMLHPIDLGHSQILAHLLGQAFKQFAVAGYRLFECVHHFAPNQVL